MSVQATAVLVEAREAHSNAVSQSVDKYAMQSAVRSDHIAMSLLAASSVPSTLLVARGPLGLIEQGLAKPPVDHTRPEASSSSSAPAPPARSVDSTSIEKAPSQGFDKGHRVAFCCDCWVRKTELDEAGLSRVLWKSR